MHAMPTNEKLIYSLSVPEDAFDDRLAVIRSTDSDVDQTRAKIARLDVPYEASVYRLLWRFGSTYHWPIAPGR